MLLQRIVLSLTVVTTLLGISLAYALTATSSDRASPAEPAYGEAVLLLLQGRQQEAQQLCRSVIASDPHSFSAHMLHGEICEAMQDDVGAINAYREAQALRPNDSQPSEQLRSLLSRERGEQNRRKRSRFVAKLDPTEHESIPPDTLSRLEVIEENTTMPAVVDARLPGRDKSYREAPPAPVVQQRADIQPRNLMLERMQAAIHRGQQLDAYDRREANRLAALERQADVDAPQTSAPTQIVRFDRGLGLLMDNSAAPVRFTGLRSRMTSDTPNRDRRLNGNSISRFQIGQACRVQCRQHHVDTCQPSRRSLFAAAAFVSLGQR